MYVCSRRITQRVLVFYRQIRTTVLINYYLNDTCFDRENNLKTKTHNYFFEGIRETAKQHKLNVLYTNEH